MLWVLYLHGHVLKRIKTLQSPSTMLLHLSLQPGKPHSGLTLPHWSRVWSKCFWSSHIPRLTTSSWIGFCLSCLSWALFFTPTLAQLPFLPLVSTASPCQLEALSSSPFLLPHPTTCPLSPDGFQLSFQQLHQEALSAPEQGRGCPGWGLVLLGNLFLSPPTWFSLAVSTDAGTTNDSNTTEAVVPVAVYLLFMVIVMKGFADISSLPSSVKTDIILCFCSMPT